ncbi:MAG: hypothetical protein ACO4AC_02040 [Pseudohongiellaceae bacterium]
MQAFKTYIYPWMGQGFEQVTEKFWLIGRAALLYFLDNFHVPARYKVFAAGLFVFYQTVLHRKFQAKPAVN